MFKKRFAIYSLLIFILLGSCISDTDEDSINQGSENDKVVFLVIDEDSIDNVNEPNNFSETDVNDQLATIGLREQLKYFRENVGKTIELYTGQVGDEAWFAIKTIPNTWRNAGPTNNGAQNYLAPGPGLGSPNVDDDREVLLDEIPEVTPLRATGLKMLEGYTILAVVYDSDISINYSPLEANLMGDNLGMVAFQVVSVTERTDGSTSSLPKVSVKILNVIDARQLELMLFSNAPVPRSSSEPFDIKPPSSSEQPALITAN
ncbi:hypothetical protein [Shivajiella indica]|uniref:Lipoprotein n=1 Tax=Shivajiella indica TaxID=872115 RepID=A0ABW5BDF6_9BACT